MCAAGFGTEQDINALAGERNIFSRREPARRETGSPCTIGNTADQTRLKPCKGKPFDLSNELELENQKGNPG